MITEGPRHALALSRAFVAGGVDRVIAWGGHGYRTRVRTASISGDSLECHVDGEVFEAGGTLEVKLVPEAIHVAGL